MQAKASDWYKKGWSLDIKNQSWTEDTQRQVDFLVRTLGLVPGQRVLDLACGYGRHALELARRGFEVVGVDITPAYIEDAQQSAAKEHLNAQFSCMDVREVTAENEFDAVLNMADGAVGYLETDEENEKIFSVVARALKPGGHHFLDVPSGEHAAAYFPKTSWETGEKCLSLAMFDWNPATHRMLFGGKDIEYGTPLPRVEIPAGDPTRLYTRQELTDIYAARGMVLRECFADFTGKPADVKEFQLLAHAQKL